jgi:hypothetical protein
MTWARFVGIVAILVDDAAPDQAGFRGSGIFISL